MTIDCRWMNDNLEAYCCDRLSPEDGRLAKTHLGNCEACAHELGSIEAIDPLVKGWFRYQLSVARNPPTRRRLAPAAVLTCALASLVLVAVLQSRPDAPPPLQTSAVEAPPAAATIESVVPKNVEPLEVNRAKPEAAVTPSPASSPVSGANAGIPSEAFAVIDQAGYVRRLNDYRGYVLLFGVWSKEQPAAAASLEQLYRTFGDNTRFRLLGIAASRQDGPSGFTFPVVYNQESQLLGALTGDFVVIDATGVERLRGSLTDTAGLIPGVRTILQSQ